MRDVLPERGCVRRTGRAALRHGIWILLLPACSVFLGICTLIYRRRNASR